MSKKRTSYSSAI